MESFEIDANAPFDYLHLASEDLNSPSPHPSPSNPDSSKKLQQLEQETNKLRLALENSRTEINFLKSTNNVLKQKIGELFQEAQASLVDKLKLQNTIKDQKCQLAMIENSSKWYQARLHESEAANKSLKTDLETHQKILHQREQTIVEYMEKLENNQKLKIKFEQLERKYQIECQYSQKELNLMKNNSSVNSLTNSSSFEPQKYSEEKILELRKKIEEISRDLELAEKRYSNVEMFRCLEEKKSLSYKKQLEKLREDFNFMEIEKNETVEKLKVLNSHGEDLRIENERLNIILLASKKEKVEVEGAIVELRLQLTQMIAEYKALRSRNVETEGKLRKEVERIKEVEKENKRVEARNLAANNSLLGKIKEEKDRCEMLEEVLREERAKSIIDHQKGETINSMTICLRQALNREKDLRDRLKLLSKNSDESVDEGYADNAGFPDIPMSSPSPLNSGLMNFTVNLLIRSQNFMAPVKSSLNELEMKLQKLSLISEQFSVKCR